MKMSVGGVMLILSFWASGRIQKIITLLFLDQIDRGFLHWIPLNMSFILCNYDHLLRMLIGRENGKVQKGNIRNS